MSEIVQKDISLNKKSIFLLIAKVAWPVAVEQLFASLINSLSTMLVSSIGAEAVNAVSIGNQVNYIPYVFLQAFNVGGTALVARFLGMENKNHAKKAAANTLFLSTLIGICSGLILTGIGGPIIRLLGATDDYYYYAMDYIRYCSVGIIFESMTLSISAVLRAAGKTKYTMIFNMFGSVMYVVAGKFFINVLGMEVAGAGAAYVVSKVSAFLIAAGIIFFKKDLDVKLTPAMVIHPDRDFISRILNIGLSAALEMLALRIGYMIFTAQITGLGTASYAAHNIGNTIDNYSCAIAQSLSIALTSLVGQNLGAGRPDVADECFHSAIRVGIVLSLPFVVAFVFFPQYLAQIYIDDPEVEALVCSCLHMLAITTPGQLVNMSICGGLRGGGDTRWPLIASVTGILFIRTGITYIMLHVFNMGLQGAWLAMAMDQNLRCMISYFRYRSGKWKAIKV